MTSLRKLSPPDLPCISQPSPTSSVESVAASLIDLGELYKDGYGLSDDGWDSNGFEACEAGGCLKNSGEDSLSDDEDVFNDDDPPVVEGNPVQINFIAHRVPFTPKQQPAFHRCYHGCGCIYDESGVVAMLDDILHPVVCGGVFDYFFDE